MIARLLSLHAAGCQDHTEDTECMGKLCMNAHVQMCSRHYSTLRKDKGVPTASIAHGVLCILCCLLDLSCRVRQVEGRDVEQAEELALARSPLLLAGLCLQASQQQSAIRTFDQHWPVLSIVPKFKALVDDQQNCMGARTFAVNSFAKSGALGSDWPAFLPIVPERPACIRRSIQKHQRCITSLQALVTDASAFHLMELSNTPSDCLAA